jgi:6-hydroxycyclohex-1-ene-1-carbonyl-CoA dehydrogenase
MPIRAYGYSLETPGEPLTRREFVIETLAPGEAVVRVAGCGLCHTDISFYSGQVKPRQMPVILGHEISGTVVAAGEDYKDIIDGDVVVPAVMPCGDCDMCKRGRGNVCPRQSFPGNDFDGGFASHVKVPARFLCPVPADTGNLKLAQLSVIADAITTPYQALLRAGVEQGDLGIVVGVGGIGTYMLQHAKNAGATVIAIDVDETKLENARKMGAQHAINAKDFSDSELKKAVRALVKENKLPSYGWKVFETSGTASGQKNAFALLSFAGTLAIVGFTMDKVDVRLSNVMAFDADVFGNWACRPEYYPDVVAEVLSEKVNVRDNIEEYPLDSINDVIGLALKHKLERRPVLVP